MDKIVALINSSEMNMAQMEETLKIELPPIKPQDLSGKNVIVTGANAGLGFEIAKSLASMNPQKIILACRNAEKAKEAVTAIRAANPSFKGELDVWTIDQSSFSSVRSFAKRYNDTKEPLDLLVCNAGLTSHGWVQTPDNLEVTIQVNHLSTMLLVLLLVPALQLSTKKPRVEIVASDVHFWASIPEPSDPHPVQAALKEANLNMFSQYPASKIFNVLFAKEFAKRCPHQIWICSTNPSYTESQLGTKDPMSGDHKGPGFAGLLSKKRSTYEGAKTLIDVVINPNVGQSGGYYSDMKEGRTRTTVNGEVGATFAANVWKDSVEILKPHIGDFAPQSWMGF